MPLATPPQALKADRQNPNRTGPDQIRSSTRRRFQSIKTHWQASGRTQSLGLCDDGDGRLVLQDVALAVGQHLQNLVLDLLELAVVLGTQGHLHHVARGFEMFGVLGF